MVLLETEARHDASAATSPGPRPAFAEVYDDHLDAVWRFLRSRVGDQHVAEDLTSEVFVRAWRSWERFDHTRGRVAPWLWTIVHRTLVDHWRRHRPEPMDLEDGDLLVEFDRLPEDEVLREDLLRRLGAGLERLQPRERDALAMRFAARLPVRDVATVLGLGLSATKMLLHRAVERLRDEVADVADVDLVAPADLEAVVDDILARGTSAMPDGQLQALLVHLAVVHDAPVPRDLHDEVADCVQCDTTGDRVQRSRGRAGRGPRRTRLAGAALAVLFFVPVCLACTVSVASIVVAASLGSASLLVHELTLLTTPVIVWMLAVARRRHGGTLGFRLAAAGAVVVAVHGLAHLGWHLPPTSPLGESLWQQAWAGPAFEWTNRVGTALLVAGAAVSHRDARRWRQREAELVTALAQRRTATAAP